MSFDENDAEALARVEGHTGIIMLNRPAALNALTLEMIRTISGCLHRWADDPAVKAVFIYGAGERAFCAGGDIKAAYQMGMKYRRGQTTEEVISLFFAEEYDFNRQIYHYAKPIIAYMDGITMGGGFGIAGPCRYRLANENTVFAMPETAIGFFPDVGSTYFLNKCPWEAGTYLAVTGSTIGAADMVWCGLATHYAPQRSIEDILSALNGALDGGGDSDTAVRQALESLHRAPDAAGPLRENREIVDACFIADTVEAIRERLAASGAAWAEEVESVIAGRSPTSLKVSLAHYRRVAGLSFDEVLELDFRLAIKFLLGHDFYEGVRAMVIDKDRRPSWEPGRLEDVSAETVEEYLETADRLPKQKRLC